MQWTPEEDAVILEGFRRGLSATQIAKKLAGASRNAVIGRYHRIQKTHFPSDDVRAQEDAARHQAHLLKVQQKRTDEAAIVATMLKAIGNGQSRNRAIKTARKAGATLQCIGGALGITRERVRQIVDRKNLAA